MRRVLVRFEPVSLTACAANAITDSTVFTEQRTLEKLPDFLGSFCKNPDSLAKASKKKGNPHSIIVTGAGLRAADIVRYVYGCRQHIQCQLTPAQSCQKICLQGNCSCKAGT